MILTKPDDPSISPRVRKKLCNNCLQRYDRNDRCGTCRSYLNNAGTFTTGGTITITGGTGASNWITFGSG